MKRPARRSGPREVLRDADAVLAVQGPDPAGLAGLKPGALVVGALNPFGERERVDAYATAGLEALAMEFMPRITRAQSMDMLSSQSNLAGYKAVLDAAARIWPRLSDDDDRGRHDRGGARLRHGRRRRRPAGDRDRPAARRDVSATDVRAATKEQIESLGAKAIFVENVAGIEGEGSGGYATEMSDEYKTGAGRARLRPYRQAGHRHHHRADPGPAGAAADHRRPARDDEAGQRDRRSRGRAGRQCRGRRARARWSSATASGSSAIATCRAASPPTPRRSTRATSTISSAPSGTRRRSGRCFPTTTRSCRACG